MCFVGYSTASSKEQVSRHRIKDDVQLPRQRVLNDKDNRTFRWC